jgi:general secretion pathway protein H
LLRPSPALRPRPRRAPRARAGRRAAERGLTLIEITIALLIVGLLVFVAVPSIEALAGVRAREEAGRISGAVRYMYGHSALIGKVCRLVFDIDGRAWWAECTQDRFTVGAEPERSRDGKPVVEETRPRTWTANTSASLIDEGKALQAEIEKEAEFSSFKSDEVEQRSLPNGANLEVWVSHQTERYTSGKAYLYFFPQGHTEKAHIYVKSDGDDVYTLVVSPLNGKVKVVPEELDDPRR